MKNQKGSLVLLMPFMMLSFLAVGQKNSETEIRVLEKAEGEAWVNKDTSALQKLFSRELVVNTPLNKVATYNEVMHLARMGIINVSSDEKHIEKITFVQNMAVVMGKDIVTPVGEMANAGKTVTRSYMDVWIKNKTEWKLTIRQATIIKIE